MSLKPSDLYVISVISNPMQFKVRPRLFGEFQARNASSGATHIYIEAAYGERGYEVTQGGDAYHIQVRCDHDLWLKENLINVAASRLPHDWKYVAWLDGDVEFTNQDWVMSTLHQLQRHQAVQLWQNCLDMGPNKESLHGQHLHQGFGYGFQQGNEPASKYGPYMHPGYGWAFRREAWEGFGGMIDLAILGSGDDHMAKGMLGLSDRSLPPQGLHPNYVHMVKAWEDRAVRAIRRDIGFVPGTILHHFHGHKKDRKYWDRWDILKKHQYDPYTDVYKDTSGILRLNHNGKHGLRDGIRAYFRERNEDVGG